MYADQEKIAKLAIMKKELRDKLRELKFREHQEHIKGVELFGIPYKILKEMSTVRPGTVAPNKYYPNYKGNILSFEKWISQERSDLWIEDVMQRLDSMYKGIPNDKGILTIAFDYEHLKEKYKEVYPDYMQSQITIDFGDMQQVNYYFGWVFDGYNLDEFNCFDLFGDTKHSQADIEDFRTRCKQIQAHYKADKEQYFNGMDNKIMKG